MKTKRFVLLLTCIIVLALTSCTSQPTIDSAALGTIVALNVQLTQSAVTVNALTAQKSATPQPTPTSAATETPTPAPTLTATPSGVWLTVAQNTNCRYGPGTYYPLILTLNAGTQVQAIATSSDGQYSYVRVLDTTVHYCWVWNQTASHIGDTSILPVYTAIPTSTPTITPTPAAGFTVTYNSLSSCVPNYSLVLFIKNTGYMTWQSIKIVIVDNTAGITVTHTSDLFTGYSGCAVSQQQGDLTTNETGLVSNYLPGEFSYNPTGHALTVTVSLYSDNGLSGTVMSQTLAVTP